MKTIDYSKNKKYQSIISTSNKLFSKHGIKKVSIEEICSKSNVSKMTFYKFFDNKSDLVKILLQNMLDESIKQYQKLVEKDIPFIEKVKELIYLKIKRLNDFSNDFIREILEVNSEAFNYIMQAKEKSEQLTKEFLELGQSEGVFRKELTPELMSYLQDKTIEMFNDKNLKKLKPDAHERIEFLTKIIFYGMFENKDNEPEIIVLPSLFL